MNSATHTWGSQRLITGDESKNNFWVAILTFGEGWHNNHHAAAQVARHGLAWYEFDMNWYGICVLRMLGLAWDVKLPRFITDAPPQPVTLTPADTPVINEELAPVTSGD